MHILAYAPVDNYANNHQTAAMWVALAFIALIVFGVIRAMTRSRPAS